MKRFEMTAEHVALLRASHVSWNEMEWGSATVDPKRPYGNGDIDRDLHGILGDARDWDDEVAPKEQRELAARYRRLHAETETALQVVLVTGSFELGVYEARDYTRDWRLV